MHEGSPVNKKAKFLTPPPKCEHIKLSPESLAA